MSRIIVQPHKLDLESPGRRDYLVALEHDSLWADHLMPLTVFVGPEAKPGKGLVSFGSNHGNEYEGPVVLKNLLSEIKLENVRGRIILVPVLNPPAFWAGTRESTLDDGVNLNRAFIDGAGINPATAGITHRIAKFVREYIWPQVHVVIDLHSGGHTVRFAECSSFHPVDDPELSRAIEQTARWFGTPLVITYQNQTPGLLPSEAERLGKITIGTELGWGQAVSRRGVQYGRQGVLAAAINHSQLAGEIKPFAHHADGTQRRVEMVDRDCFHTVPFLGHYEPCTDCGVLLKKGDLIGRVHDFDYIDKPGYEVRAQLDGVLIAQSFAAAAPRGQHVAVVGKVMEWMK
jgi:predicted deacylase